MPMLAMWLGAAPAGAQQPTIERERVGPEVAPPPLPAFPEPRTILPERPLPPTQSPVGGTAIRLEEVHVIEDGAPARPTSGWTGEDAATGLMLDHVAGQPIDALWVHRQFEINAMIGRPIDAGRIIGLVQLINRNFIAAGYINSGLLITGNGIPADGASLELRLVSGRVVPAAGSSQLVSVEWRGDPKGLDPSFVQDRMPATRQVPFDAVALERDFRLLADDPAIRSINANLRPGSRPGEATLGVTVVPANRSDLYLDFSNSRSPSIGGERLSLGGSLRNVIIAGDLIAGEVGTTSGREDFFLSYETPFVSPRMRFFIRGGRNEAAVVDRPLVPLDIESMDATVETGINYRIIDEPLTPAVGSERPVAAQRLTLGALLTKRVSRSFLLGEPFSFSPGSVDGRAEYTAARLTADWVERNVYEVWAVSVTATSGLDGTRPEDPEVIAPDATFKSALIQGSYARRLGRHALELRLRLAAQIADGILYSAERFSVGGADSVRGYRENLLLADEGLLASIELVQPFSLTRGRRSASFDPGAFNASIFADGALVRNKEVPDPIPRKIASVGVSIAWTPSEAISARVTYGVALRDIPALADRDLQDDGLQFRITVHPLRLFR